MEQKNSWLPCRRWGDVVGVREAPRGLYSTVFLARVSMARTQLLRVEMDWLCKMHCHYFYSPSNLRFYSSDCTPNLAHYDFARHSEM
jgi:hypothetical protein